MPKFDNAYYSFLEWRGVARRVAGCFTDWRGMACPVEEGFFQVEGRFTEWDLHVPRLEEDQGPGASGTWSSSGGAWHDMR